MLDDIDTWRADPVSFAVHLTRNAPRGARYLRYRHLTYLSRAITRAFFGIGPRNLIIEMPPRHGKSFLVSQWLPVWVLDQNPYLRVILASYEASFAASWGEKAQKIANEYESELCYSAQGPMKSWKTGFGEGGMHTAGVGGRLTGQGGDVLIIDDPVKNAEEALSKNNREKKWDWYKSTFESRREPGAMTILMATRWHFEDLIGKVLSSPDEDEKDWDRINLPALAKENDELGRKPGEALCPERYDEEALEKIKKGNVWWPSLYQQDPTADEGDIFKKEHFRYYSRKGKVLTFEDDEGVTHRVDLAQCGIFQTIDLAASTKEEGDYTVISTWAVDHNANLFLIDVLRERLSSDHLSVIQAQYTLHKPIMIGVESVAYQLALFKRCRRKGLPVKKLVPDKDKITRALLAATRLEAHTIFFPDDMDHELTKELLQFPKGAHDDFVDTLSYAAWGISFEIFKAIKVGRIRLQDDELTEKEHSWKSP